MRSIFSRKPGDPNRRPDPENRPEQRHDLLALVPASARSYETQRLYAHTSDDPENDGPDEDLEFLESLVDEIDRTPVDEAERRVQPAPGNDRTEPNLLRARPRIAEPKVAVRAASDDETKLNVFRAMRDEPERTRTSQDLGVRDVDLADLLEELSTTAAAIRLRKAA